MIDPEFVAQFGNPERPEANVIELLRPILEPVAEANPTVEQAREWCAAQRRAHGWHTQDWWTPEGILRFVWMARGLGAQLLENVRPSGLYVRAADLMPSRSVLWDYETVAVALTTVYSSQLGMFDG